MMEVSNIASQHLHDVSVIWYAWPFNVILWKPVQDFLQGHSFNWINNIMLDLFAIPITIWNLMTGFWFWWFNLFWFFVNLVPNVVFGIISGIIFWIPDTIYAIWKSLPQIILSAIGAIIPQLLAAGNTSSSSSTSK